MGVDIVLLEGFDELDTVGPFEVFANAGGDRAVQQVTCDGRSGVVARGRG